MLCSKRVPGQPLGVRLCPPHALPTSRSHLLSDRPSTADSKSQQATFIGFYARNQEEMVPLDSVVFSQVRPPPPPFPPPPLHAHAKRCCSCCCCLRRSSNWSLGAQGCIPLPHCMRGRRPPAPPHTQECHEAVMDPRLDVLRQLVGHTVCVVCFCVRPKGGGGIGGVVVVESSLLSQRGPVAQEPVHPYAAPGRARQAALAPAALHAPPGERCLVPPTSPPPCAGAWHDP